MQDRRSHRALVVGATGISGQAVTRELLENGWQTYGLSRKQSLPVPDAIPIAADLLDTDQLSGALQGIEPELIFVTAWMRQENEARNIDVNSRMLRNVLAAVEDSRSVRHVALMTGLKHYLGSFDDYGSAVNAETPFHENEPRLPSPNFYYAQEDELFAAAQRMGFSWSVHRSHTIFGFATGNAMNMALTLAVYATLCRETAEPFVFPGSQTQWEGLTDVTDASLLGEQMVWAATTEAGANQAFNTANGDVFRWRWLWPQLAAMFDVEPVGFDTTPRPLEPRMTNAASQWHDIAERYGLVEYDVTKLASWWHTDADLGRDMECLCDTTKARQAGFSGFRSTPQALADVVAQYRRARIIP